MIKLIVVFLMGMFFAGGGTYKLLGRELADALTKTEELTGQVETVKKSLFGYTSYKDYLAAGQKALTGQASLITATVTRPESHIKFVQSSLLGVSFNATVKVSYDADYSFGYDLSPQNYSIRETARGIEIVLKSPLKLVATPASRNLKGEVLQTSIAINGHKVLNGVYQQLPTALQAQGLAMTKDPTVIALCEKRLVAFLRDFLSKQPGVTFVPDITVR